MRAFVLPAALLLGFLFYVFFPGAAALPDKGLRAAYAAWQRLFTRKSGRVDAFPAALSMALLLGGTMTLLSAVHPVLCALLLFPLFSAPAVLPACAALKEELDSGKYVADTTAYERLVREGCRSLIAPLSLEGILPMLLCALGLPLHLGAGFGWTARCLLSINLEGTPFPRAKDALERFARRLTRWLLLVCCCVLGRSPMRTKGDEPEDRLLSILGIAGDETDTHAPVAGDLSLAGFLCCFTLCFFCLICTLCAMMLI